MDILKKALHKIVSTPIDFRKDIVSLFSQYIDALEDLANDVFEATGDVIDFEHKKLLKDSEKLIKDFIDLHTKYRSMYLALWEKYTLISDIEKHKIAREELQKFQHNIKQILKVFNVRAQIKLEDLAASNIPFKDIDKLDFLNKITYLDLEEYWMGDSDDIFD